MPYWGNGKHVHSHAHDTMDGNKLTSRKIFICSSKMILSLGDDFGIHTTEPILGFGDLPMSSLSVIHFSP